MILRATENSFSSASSGAKVTLTMASFLLLCVEISWEIFSALKVLEVDKPSANKILSIMLLLPEPFGPEIVVKPFKNGIVILFAKDLKLSISTSLMYIKLLCNPKSRHI